MLEQKPVCVVCKGKFPFLSETAWGLHPYRGKIKELADVFICWECVHSLQEEFNKHILNFSYSLLTSTNKTKGIEGT